MVKKVNAIHTGDTRNLDKKNNYNTKIKGLEKKTYITTQDFNKLTSENVAAR